jgi:hypothetical protein
MPDSYGKRQRQAQRARKFAAREERRRTRKQEKADREAGVLTPQAAEETPEGEAGEPTPEAMAAPDASSGDETESDDRAQAPPAS